MFMMKKFIFILILCFSIVSICQAKIIENYHYRNGITKYSETTLPYSDGRTITYTFRPSYLTHGFDLFIKLDGSIPALNSKNSEGEFLGAAFTYTTDNNIVPKKSFFSKVKNGKYIYYSDPSEIEVEIYDDGTAEAYTKTYKRYQHPEFNLHCDFVTINNTKSIFDKSQDSLDYSNSWQIKPFIADLLYSMVLSPTNFYVTLERVPSKYSYTLEQVEKFKITIPKELVKEWQEVAQYDKSTLDRLSISSNAPEYKTVLY